MNKIIACIAVLIGLAAANCDFSRNFCCLSGFTCPSYGNFTILDTSIGLGDFNVVSFGDLTLNHGDVQGRVAVRNNFFGTNGVSLGDLVSDSLTYSFVAGGSVNISGSAKFTPESQKIFVGNSGYSVPAEIQSRVFVGCTSSGCLNTAFDSLKTYWAQFSSSLANQAPNVAISFNEAGLTTITCNQTSIDKAYFVRLTPADFSRTTSWTTSGCVESASIVVSIVGDGDIYFQGDQLNTTAAYIIFNYAGSANVYVNTSIYGNIVAPNAVFNNLKGTIYGQLIAGNIVNLVQVNIITDSKTCQVGANPDGTCVNNGNGTPTPSVPAGSISTATTGASTPATPATTGQAPATPSTTGQASGGDSAANSGNLQTSQCVCPPSSALMASVSVFATILAIALI